MEARRGGQGATEEHHGLVICLFHLTLTVCTFKTLLILLFFCIILSFNSIIFYLMSSLSLVLFLYSLGVHAYLSLLFVFNCIRLEDLFLNIIISSHQPYLSHMQLHARFAAFANTRGRRNISLVQRLWSAMSQTAPAPDEMPS